MQTNPHIETPAKQASIETLQECFRNELSAKETYQLALTSITHVAIHNSLQQILTSHARRVDLLRDAIGRFGGETPASSGVWGAFAKAVQAGADLLGDRTAIASLEEGEDRGLRFYADTLENCDARTRRLIDTELMPEQVRSHELCRALKSYVRSPS